MNNGYQQKLKILLLSPYLPSINTTACARKIYDCISLLHRRGHCIYLLSFCSEQDKERIGVISPYCSNIHLEYIRNYSRYSYNSVSLKQKINLLCKNGDIDILQCENAYMSKYIPKNIKVSSILIEHEILSVSFSERQKLEMNLCAKLILFARKIKKRFEEKGWYRKFNKIIVFSENDKYVIRNLYNTKNVEIIPLGINLKDYPLANAEKKVYDIIFVGNFSHSANVDAVLYFYKEILPLIKNRLPAISLILVGANPPESVKKLAEFDKNISISGYVKDISEYYFKSKVFIAPIRYGTGMSYKILEASALNMPVVSTSIGARGIISNGNIKIADTKQEFSDAVIDLLKNQDKRERLAEKGRSSVERHYEWDILLNKYERIYDDLLNIT
jgi:glycosyltransferase involved in cell wall biosynthesis